MDNLFISYRRDDSAAYAGRICDRMTSIIGEGRVFMDVEAIQPGQNFAQAIENLLSGCSHVLVVIGPRWHEILQERALRSEKDYVVHEIAAALAKKKTVVPVFVGGATSAALVSLPAELSDLSFRQAVELRDTSFNDDCARLAARLRLTRSVGRRPMVWVGLAAATAVALLVLFAAQLGLGPWHAARARRLQVTQLLSAARTQAQEAEYESAVQSYQQALTLDPNNATALDGEVDAAMLLLQHFHVVTPEGQDPQVKATPLLAQLNTVLTAGLARTNGKDRRAADILAHLGWLHWLNEKIAAQEVGNAERYFAQSVAVDPTNVYAHAFWGNWLLQTRGDLAQALQHFTAALATHTQRPLVRSMELSGMLGNDQPGVRADFVQALNQMRVGSEPLDAAIRERISYLYNPTVSSDKELNETLAAVPFDDAWRTFLWLDPDQAVEARPPILQDFVHASLTEISGDSATALREFKALAKVLQKQHVNGRITDDTLAAIRRISHKQKLRF